MVLVTTTVMIGALPYFTRYGCNLIALAKQALILELVDPTIRYQVTISKVGQKISGIALA